MGDWDDLLIHRVRVERSAIAKGELGRKPAYQPVPGKGNVPCRIEGVSASQGTAADTEIGIVSYSAFFGSDPGLTYRDRLVVLSGPPGAGAKLTVAGTSDQGGGGEIWQADCVERVRDAGD